MADSVEVSTIETTDGTIGIIRDNAARQSIANLREGKETVGSVAWENVKGRPTKVSSFENDKKYQTDENVSNTLNSTLYAGSSTHGGPAISADKLTTARTISLSGAAAGSGSFDGSANSTINVSSLDATKLTGTVPITNLPPSVIERMSVVKDDTERLALTKDSVQDGDVVKVQSSGLMYYVIDDDKLNEEAGYEVFTVGTAASVPWGGVTGKPSTFPPSSHTHSMSQITDLGVFGGASATAAGSAGLVPQPAAGDQDKYLSAKGTWESITGKIDPSAITTNAANIKKNADAISAEVTRAKAAEKANADTISKLNSPENPALLGPEDDLNNVLTGGFYHINDGYNPANMPSGNDNAVLLVMQGRSHADIVQILISVNSNNILYRTGNTLIKFWKDWGKIADNSVATESTDGLMSAADKKAIDREFFRLLPKGGTYIPANADLNTIEYIKIGSYYNLLSTESMTMKNIPIGAAFIMYVLAPLSEDYDNEETSTWVYRLRIFINYGGQYIYTQSVYSDTTPGNFYYGPWIKQTNSNDLGAVSNKSAKYTLTASNWSGDTAPYTYDLGPTYGANAIIGFDSAVGNTTQLEAARAADIQGSSTTKIYAYGDKPTVDIPIVIIYQ